MPLVESIIRNSARHVYLLWNDFWFVSKTFLFVAWLCMGFHRETLGLPVETEMGMHFVMELTYSSFRWRNLFGFAGVLMDLVMPFVWMAIVSVSYDLFKILPVWVKQLILKWLWNCLFPKVVFAYLAMLFKKLKENHARLFM